MSRITRTAVAMALLSLLSATVVVGATMSAGGASSDHDGATVKVTVLDRQPYVVDQPPADISNGDVLLFEEPLVDPKSGHSLGASETRVQIVQALEGGDALFILDCTFRLPGGNLVFTGSERFSHVGASLVFAVVGGTGRFAGARGTVTITPTQVNGETGGQALFRLLHPED